MREDLTTSIQFDKVQTLQDYDFFGGKNSAILPNEGVSRELESRERLTRMQSRLEAKRDREIEDERFNERVKSRLS